MNRNIASALYFPPAAMSQRVAVTIVVVVLHFGVFAAWQMQPLRAAIVPPEMEILLAMMTAPAALQAETLPPQRVLETVPIRAQPMEQPALMEAPAMTNEVSALVAAMPPVLPNPPLSESSLSSSVTEVRFDADYLQNPKPSYPFLSRKLAEQGKVLLQVTVTAAGTASHIYIKQGSGYPRLDQAALNTVRQWRFIPARQGDEAVSAQVVVPIVFRLDS